ncbi:MAG: hypothetical protein OSB62_01325 [Alphaproteobacteria bacterium]|nr:hypothetical protein [Alphaproteobacteria bacterium]
MQVLLFIYTALEIFSLFLPEALMLLVFLSSIGYIYTAVLTFRDMRKGAWKIAIKNALVIGLSVYLVFQTQDMYQQALGLLIASFLCINAVEQFTFMMTHPKTFKRGLLESLLALVFYWPLRFAWLIIMAEILIRLFIGSNEPPSMMA